MQNFVSAAISDVGHVRQSNEDSYYASDKDGLWIVADGMGGHSHGKTASQMACNVVSEQLAQGFDMPQAIDAAHKAIQQLSQAMGTVNGMGTTLVAISTAADNCLDIWWLGDSRAYIQTDIQTNVRKNVQTSSELTLLTRDHSVVQELMDAHLISPEQADDHHQKHVITRALGINTKLAHDNTSQAEHTRIQYKKGAILMLCSDGLTKEVSEQAMRGLLSSNDKLESKARALVAQANANGGSDNITVLLLEQSVRTEYQKRAELIT